MKVKNLCVNPIANICSMMLLDIHKANVTWVDTEPADLVIFDHVAPVEVVREYPADIKLCLDLQHAEANKHRCWLEVGWIRNPEPNEFVVIECEDPGISNSKTLFNDFLWNRSKAYYTNFEWNLATQRWYYHNPDAFQLQPISTADQKTRLFLSPNKIGRPNAPFRTRLADVALRYDLMPQGYVSNITWKLDGTRELAGNRNTPDAVTVEELYKNPTDSAQGYDPVHNAFYNETFFSTYVETFETGTTQFVTEKTLDPLIKGHFILPFSTAGFVAYLKSQGWRMPDFIDYSYDSISDEELRFRAFREELFRLCSIKIDEWRQLWVDNIDIIKYNRNQLYNRPYHKLPLLERLLQSEIT